MDSVGVNVIETAALGRPFQLGMLYDCRKDALIPGITLWDPEKLQQSLRVRPQINTDFKVMASDSIEDKSNLLNIDGSLKLSVLGGLINVTGSAKYLKDTKKSFKQQRLTLHYHSTCRFEELTMNHLASEKIVHHEVLDKDTATHVVTAVLYGADACFVFDREVSSNEEISKVEGEAKVALEKLKILSVDVNVNLKMDDTQKNAVQKFTCSFYGDFQLPSNPTSFEDALKVFSDLPNLLGDKKELAVPLRVWLYPLDKLHSGASKLQKDISMDLIIETESVIESLNTTEMKCNDLLKDSPASTFPEFHDKILQMKQNCHRYKLRLMNKLGFLLPNIRGDVMKETDLNNLLQEHDESPFRGRDLAEWLKERERESDIIKSVLRQLKEAGAQIGVNIDLVLMDLDVGNAVCYTFTSLNWSGVLLPKQKAHLSMSAKGETGENSLDSEQKSWLTPEIQKALKNNLMIFKNLMVSKDHKSSKFIVSSKEMKNNPGSCILLYESECDEAVCFIPPSKPACPITEEVKDNSVVLKVPPSCPATVELRLLYKPKKETEWTSKPVMKDELTVTLTDLRAGTEYEIKCAALGKLNYTVYSDVISVTTEGRGSLIVDTDFEGERQSIPSTCSDVRWSPGALYRVPRGLINQGMTCYLNAVLQMLFMTDEFRDRVLSLREEVSGKSSEELLPKALADLFRSLQQERAAVSTRELTKALNITNVHKQQDAAEYLQMILHRVPEPSEIFRGITVASTMCSVCKHNNEEVTEFVSIPLSINDRGTCDVERALMEYMGIHDMSGEDRLYCVTCDSMRDMETRNYIKKWPGILTLQLKRFEMEFIRNECKVNISPHIQVESSPEYDLYGIINHHGSVNGGRNEAVIKERENWYRFNDDRVTKIQCSGYQWINDRSAYLLMYRKRYCGLEDRGSSSSLNAVLQTLFMTEDFRKHVESLDRWSVSSDEYFTEELKKLFRELEAQERSAVSSAEIRKSLGVTDVHQRDAADLLRLILGKTGSSELFKVTMKTTRTCRSYKHKPEEISEDFLSLPVSFQHSQDVEDALQAYAGEHKRVDSVRCDHCLRWTDIETKSEMMKSPDHLIVQLKRSESHSSYGSSSEVILRPHIEVSSHRYELYAVVNYKKTLSSERYHADIKCEDGLWHRFEDRNVSESLLNGVFRSEISTHRSSEARLLVYRRRAPTAGDAGGDLSPRSRDLPLPEEKKSSGLRKKSEPQSQIQTGAQHHGLEAQKERLITQVQKAVHGVTREEAKAALDQNQWSFTPAVQQLKVDQLHNMSWYSREECRQTLISFNWDLERAFSVLTQQNSQGSALYR